MSKIRVGIIGAGAIANDHCRGVNRHPDAQVTAVADTSAARAAEIQAAYKLDRTFTRWEDLVADPAIDAVTIALPNALHAPVALAALKAGKHVLLDKPFALNAQEAEEVVRAAERAGKVFMLGMNQRYGETSQALRTIVGRGELGEVFHTRACWLRRAGAPKFGTWFGRKDLAGGGCLLDIGVHALDLALYLIDNFQPASVSGRIYSKFGPRGIGEGGWGKSDKGEFVFDVDDSAFALIKFANGSTMELEVSWVLHQDQANKMNVEIYGTEAGASLSPLRIFRFGKNKGEYEAVEPQGVPPAFGKTSRQANWIDVILGKAAPLTPARQSLVVQKVLDAIYASSASGRDVVIA
jgi:predicted dehydrogenase